MTNTEHITILYEAILQVLWNFAPVVIFAVVILIWLAIDERRERNENNI